MSKPTFFGVGMLAIKDSSLAIPIPVNAGILSEVSLDTSRDVKELVGENMCAEDLGLGKLKISGKAKTGQFKTAIIAAVLAGSTVADGQTVGAKNEKHTIPSATAYTVDASNKATFVENLGVYDYTAGKWLDPVSATPASGQYSVSSGVYTFAEEDKSHSVGLFYSYTVTAGATVTLENQLMGAATKFELTLFNNYDGKKMGYKLFATVFPKLSFAGKNEDFTLTDLEFQACANDEGKIIELYASE